MHSTFTKIVAPGGSYEKAVVACAYGADEVYVGVPFTSLRMRQNKISSFDLFKILDDLFDKLLFLTKESINSHCSFFICL